MFINMTKFINLSKYPFTIFSSLIILLFAVSASVSAQNVEEGEKLYKANCTACHQIDNKLIGPALRGVSDKYSEEWLIKWIKNSAEMIASGDQDAIAIWEEYNKSPMTAFPYLSDDDVKNILAYIEQAPEKQAVIATTSVDGGAIVVEDQTSDYVILTITIILLLVIAGLWKIKNTLKEVAGEESEDLFSSTITLVNAFLARKSLVTLTVFIILGFVSAK